MAIDIRACTHCGSLFNSYGTKVCAECADKLDEMFVELREFVYDNPNVGVKEISKKTGIETKIILEFLRQGRLEINSDEAFLACEKCGKPINSDRFCIECKEGLERAVNSVSTEYEKKMIEQKIKEEEKAKKTIRMHLDFDR